MHAIITGMNGTVAPALAAALRAHGTRVTPWDRSADPPDSAAAVRVFIERHRPTAVCHVATGAPEWAQWIASTCNDLEIPLLWTGSVSVFGSGHRAPFTPDMQPDATDDYGRYKIHCETLVRSANARAIIARLGWQIGDAPGSNTMTDFLARAAATGQNRIEASTRWTPSCARLGDTAAGLVELLRAGEPGLYHLEGNSAGLSFHEIALRIRQKLTAAWAIAPVQAPAMDNRMLDPRITIGQVADSLAKGSE